jgi:hypothetical protein
MNLVGKLKKYYYSTYNFTSYFAYYLSNYSTYYLTYCFIPILLAIILRSEVKSDQGCGVVGPAGLDEPVLLAHITTSACSTNSIFIEPVAESACSLHPV